MVGRFPFDDGGAIFHAPLFVVVVVTMMVVVVVRLNLLLLYLGDAAQVLDVSGSDGRARARRHGLGLDLFDFGSLSEDSDML